MSINVSAQQLARTELVGEVRSALRSSGLDPHCLMLEITESVLISDVQLAIERLSALRKLGVRIALDDFGTGYSSLSYILQLPIDILKIDKRFIDSVDCDDRESRLTAAIIGLARTLDLRCVAEGIERPTQHERLKELGCDYAQGVLLAHPMSSDALQDLLTATPVPRLQLAPTGSDTPLGLWSSAGQHKGPEPLRFRAFSEAGEVGLEPTTFRLTADRYCQLSYSPNGANWASRGQRPIARPSLSVLRPIRPQLRRDSLNRAERTSAPRLASSQVT